MTHIRPTRHRVLIKLDPKQTHYGSSVLVTPDLYREQQTTALAVAVGPGDERGPCHVKPGQRLLVGKWNGVQVKPPEDDPKGDYWIVNADPDNYLNPGALNCVRIEEVLGVIED